MKFGLILAGLGFFYNAFGQLGAYPQYFERDSNRLTLHIPNVDITAYSSSITPNKVIFEAANETVIDFQNAIGNLDNLNDLIMDVEINTIGLSYKFSNIELLAGHRARYFGNLQYTKELAELTTLGNANFIGQTVDISPNFNYTHYHEIYLGGKVDIGQLKVQTKIKLLAGNEHVSAVNNRIALTTETEIYTLQLENDIDIYSSALLQYSGIEDINTDFDPDVFNSFFGKNQGFAFDFGLEWDVHERLKIYGILEDLGSITWDKRTDRYFKSGITNYEGIDILDFLSEDGNVSLKDSLYDLLDLENEEGISFTKDIPFSWQVGFVYRMNGKSQIDAFIGKANFDSIRASKWRIQYAYSINNHIHLFANLNGFGKSLLNAGLGVELDIGPVFILFHTSNVIGLTDLLGSRYNHLNLGLGLKF